MVSGDILPSSKLGGLGLGGIKLSGSLDDGLTVLEILVPISEKKVLNSSAISLGLVIVFPLAIIEVRLLDLVDLLVASLRSSHVLFGSFL
jgi:hypothetical protein